MGGEKRKKSGIRLYTVPDSMTSEAFRGGKGYLFLFRTAVLGLLSAAWWYSFLCVFPMHIDGKLLYLFLFLFAAAGVLWAVIPLKTRVLGLAFCAVIYILFYIKNQKLFAAALHYLANAYLRIHDNEAKQLLLMTEPAVSAWALPLVIAGITLPFLLFWAYVLVKNRWKIPAVLLLLIPGLLAAWEGYFPTEKSCWLLIFCTGAYLAVCGSVSGRAVLLSCAGAAACLSVLFAFSSVGAKPFEASKSAENGIYIKARRAISKDVVGTLTAMTKMGDDKKGQEENRQKDKSKKQDTSKKTNKNNNENTDRNTNTLQKEQEKKYNSSGVNSLDSNKNNSGPGMSAAAGSDSVLGGGSPNLKAITGFAPDNNVDLTVKVNKRPQATYYYPEEYGGTYNKESWEELPVGKEMYAQYSQYPKDLTRLIKLCKSQKVSTVDEAARFIQQEFEKNTVYDYNPGPTPGSQDFAEYFLFENKKGFCVHFATTATLMYRIFGFKARYAQGFAIPVSAFKEQPDGTYKAKVTGDMGHAWCETYDENGWTIREHTLPYLGNKKNAYSPASDYKERKPYAMPYIDKFIFSAIGILFFILLALALFLFQASIRRRRRHDRCKKYRKGTGILEAYHYLSDIGRFLGADRLDPADPQSFQELKTIISQLSETEWDWIQRLVWQTLYAEEIPSKEEHVKLYKMVKRAAIEVQSAQTGLKRIKYNNIDCLGWRY